MLSPIIWKIIYLYKQNQQTSFRKNYNKYSYFIGSTYKNLFHDKYIGHRAPLDP